MSDLRSIGYYLTGNKEPLTFLNRGVTEAYFYVEVYLRNIGWVLASQTDAEKKD